jgi:hypothetical protein
MDALRIAWLLPFAAGLLALGSGLYLLALPDGLAVKAHADFVGRTSAQLAASDPRMLDFLTQEVRLIGALMVGAGLLLALVSWGGLRTGQRWAWLAVAGSLGVSLLALAVGAGHHPVGDEGFGALSAIAALQMVGLALGLPALKGGGSPAK